MRPRLPLMSSSEADTLPQRNGKPNALLLEPASQMNDEYGLTYKENPHPPSEPAPGDRKGQSIETIYFYNC